MKNLGVHLPLAQLANLTKWLLADQLHTVQLFISDRYKYNIVLNQDQREVLKALTDRGLNLVVHMPYSINLARRQGTIKVGFIKKCFHDFFDMCLKIGCRELVVHVGSTMTTQDDWPEALSQVLNYITDFQTSWLDKRHTRDELPRVNLENTCGGGTSNGNIYQLAEAISDRNDSKLGFCLDTTHAYAAGTNILETPDYVIGAATVMHLNIPNPDVRFGGHLDRHDCLFDQQRIKVNWPAFMGFVQQETPLIIENGLNTALTNKSYVEQSITGQRLAPLQVF